MTASPWPERDPALIHKWNAGLSTQRIADDLGLTKNQVIGRAHRLVAQGVLVVRENPTIHGGPGRPKRPKRICPTKGCGAVQGDTLAQLGVVAPPAPARTEPVVLAGLRPQPCCWPIGEPRTPEFRYCDAPGQPGRSYCAEHMAVAYLRRTPAEATEAQVAAQQAFMARRSTLTGRTARRSLVGLF